MERLPDYDNWRTDSPQECEYDQCALVGPEECEGCPDRDSSICKMCIIGGDGDD